MMEEALGDDGIRCENCGQTSGLLAFHRVLEIVGGLHVRLDRSMANSRPIMADVFRWYTHEFAALLGVN